jgi:hypothetical protein
VRTIVVASISKGLGPQGIEGNARPFPTTQNCGGRDDVPARRSPAAGQACPSPGYYWTQTIAVATTLPTAAIRSSRATAFALTSSLVRLEGRCCLKSSMV